MGAGLDCSTWRPGRPRRRVSSGRRLPSSPTTDRLRLGWPLGWVLYRPSHGPVLDRPQRSDERIPLALGPALAFVEHPACGPRQLFEREPECSVGIHQPSRLLIGVGELRVAEARQELQPAHGFDQAAVGSRQLLGRADARIPPRPLPIYGEPDAAALAARRWQILSKVVVPLAEPGMATTATSGYSVPGGQAIAWKSGLTWRRG